jgi:hypothetical protein
MRFLLRNAMREQLERHARDQNIPLEKLIRKILEEWLVEQRQNKLSVKLLKRGIF